jgi:hypothetical protein
MEAERVERLPVAWTGGASPLKFPRSSDQLTQRTLSDRHGDNVNKF